MRNPATDPTRVENGAMKKSLECMTLDNLSGCSFLSTGSRRLEARANVPIDVRWKIVAKDLLLHDPKNMNINIKYVP